MKAYIVVYTGAEKDSTFKKVIEDLELLSLVSVIELDINKVSLGRISDMRKETSNAQE